MPEYKRVRVKDTGHEITIPAGKFDPSVYTAVDRPATAPGGEPLAPKYRTTVNKAAEKKKAGSGQKATTEEDS